MSSLTARLVCLGFAGAVLVAAAPLALRSVEPGQWQVSRSATGQGAVPVCLRDIVTLAQYEHRGEACTRVILSDKPTELLVHYTCPAGDFGRTKMTVLTPRSLRLETQGIHRGEPFFYQLHARRIGDC